MGWQSQENIGYFYTYPLQIGGDFFPSFRDINY